MDGDRILVGAGSYGDQETGSSPYAIVIDKALSIESRDGALLTSINVRDTGRWPVKIFAAHVRFGKTGRGFTLVANLNLPFSGISVNEGASDVTIEGNVVSGFSRGIDMAGDKGAYIAKHCRRQ